MNNELVECSKKIKLQIEELINKNLLEEAKALIKEYEEIIKDDIGIYSMKAIILIMEGKLDEAENILINGLNIEIKNFDLNYNLAYVYEQKEKYSLAFRYYNIALETCNNESLKKEIETILENIKIKEPNVFKEKKKIVFFDKGNDNFILDIVNELSKEYEVKKVTVRNLKQIDEWMQWADICWFEWCDELIAYGSRSNLAKEKKIICRLHSYEAFTNYPNNVNWNNVDKVIFVAKHIKDFVVDKFKLNESKTVVIANGVNVNNYTFKERKPGFNIAYVGYINYKKGPMLLLHTFKAIYDRDNRYKLYIAGEFQDYRYILYFRQMIKELGIENNVFYEGWQDNLDQWLEDKNYILCTSVLESQNMSVMQAMTKGIKPIIHNFVGAKEIYDKKYIWNTIDEAVEIIESDKYSSHEYRNFIENNYSLDSQIKNIKNILFDFNKLQIKDTWKSFNYCIYEAIKKLQQNQHFDNIKDLTMIIRTFNRASLLKNDLENGFKLGEQSKIIVDDFSDNENRCILSKLNENKTMGIQDIIFHKKNKGVAIALKTAIDLVETKYTTISDDDDIVLCFDNDKFKDNLNSMDIDYKLIVPRYVLNMNEDNKISLGYDRVKFSCIECKEMLKHIFLTGEMYAFIAGAIFMTDDIKISIPDEIFRVSEDYVMLARVLANNPHKKIKVSEDYVYIRRTSNNTLSKTINSEKLSLNLISMLISGYYCLKNRYITIDEVIKSIKQRGELLHEIYGYDRMFADAIIMYINNQIGLEEFVNIINKNNIIKTLTIDTVPKEIIKIKELV